MTLAGLTAMAAGFFLPAVMPTALGVVGHLAPLVVDTVGCAVFRTADSTAVIADVRPDRRGVTSCVPYVG
ncbi:hypothetical protein [Streptomyces sp. NPDC055287]